MNRVTWSKTWQNPIRQAQDSRIWNPDRQITASLSSSETSSDAVDAFSHINNTQMGFNLHAYCTLCQWRAHLVCGVSCCWVSVPTVSLWCLGPSCTPSQSAAHHGMTWTVPSAAGTHDSIYSSSELVSQSLRSTHWTWAVDSNMSFTSSTEFVEIEQQ